MAREWVWLQCTETSDLNYRVTINPKEMDTKQTFFQILPALRKRTPHKNQEGQINFSTGDTAVAQLAEHRSPKPGVAGSIPTCRVAA